MTLQVGMHLNLEDSSQLYGVLIVYTGELSRWITLTQAASFQEGVWQPGRVAERKILDRRSRDLCRHGGSLESADEGEARL